MTFTKKNLFLIILLLTCNFVSANNFKIIASVDNHPITNYDLIIELKSQELLNNIKLNKSSYNLILNQIINNKIKDLETQKYNIKPNKNFIEQTNKNIENKYKDIANKEVIKNIQSKIILAEKWKALILGKFKNKFDININEINEKIKNKQIGNLEMNKILIMEKNKKINAVSNSYFNEIKNKYLIKFYP
jgi:hypothetical protein